MKKPTFLFILITTMAFIATSLIIWKLVISRPTGPSAPTPSPTPSVSKFIIPTTLPQEGKVDSPTDLLKSLQEKFPLVEALPYETEEFSVNYLSPLHLQVKIKEATQAGQIKKAVTDWVWSKGVNPATHKIDWIIPGL